MTLGVQWLTMSVMLLSGLGMGVAFDSYRVMSHELKFPRWWLPVLDIVYWMTAAVVVFRMLYASNNGEVRAYVFIGLAIGVLLYYWFVSKIVIRMVKWCIQATRACIRFIKRVFDIMVIKPLLLLYKMAIILLGFGSALTIFTLKIVVQLVRPIWLLLWWMLRPALAPLGRTLIPYWKTLRFRERWSRWKTKLTDKWKQWFGRE